MPDEAGMLTYNFDRDSKTPVYEQLYNFIKSDIISGVISGGEKLPSKRELAAHLGISKVTVEASYGALIDEGYVTSVEKKGYYCEKNLAINTDVKAAAGRNSHYSYIPDDTVKGGRYTIDLCSNSVPRDQFPFSVWSHLMREVISDYRLELLDPIPFNGVYRLRQAISLYLLSERGMSISPDCIIIGSGSEYLYTQIIRLLGNDRFYGIENPCYPKISEVYRMNKANCLPVSFAENGTDSGNIKECGADILHISPSHNFPTGRIMSAKKRHEIISWANAGDRYIVEDDFDSELRFGGKPIPTLQTLDTRGRVIYINTFSKTISPSLRLGYMVLPDSLARRYGEMLSFSACTVPSFEQYLLAEFIEKGYFERHLSRTKKYYELLRSELLNEYRSHPAAGISRLSESDAGLHFTLNLKTDMPESEIKKELEMRGIKAAFISDYYHSGVKTPPAYRHGLLINYSGTDTLQFKTALDNLYEILEEAK